MSEAINQLLQDAGKHLRAGYDAPPPWQEKAPRDLVTELDREIEGLLTEGLQRLFPKDGFMGEELGAISGCSDATWLIDPIDGTTNFIMGKPYFAISLARTRANRVEEAYVFNPVSDELFHATSAQPHAYLNGTRITPSPVATIEQARVAFGFSANMSAVQRYHREWTDVFEQCAKGVGWIAPALTLCNVARGRVDALIDFGASPEGQAAGAFILQQAGGVVWNYDAPDTYHVNTKGIVACAPALASALRNRNPS